MIRKVQSYKSFISEGFLFFNDKIPYFYSCRFKDVIGSIKSDLSNHILYSENDKVDDISFIDISDEEDKITFIQKNRLLQIKKEEGNNDKFINWIRAKHSQTQDNLVFKGWKYQRTEMSIGRFVKRIIDKNNVKYDPQYIEKFVNLYKARIKFINNPELMFKVVEGEDIRKWYLYKNYQFDRGELSNSCMRYDRCQPFFDIYTKNTDVCKLLILHQDDETKITGRALLWTLEDNTNYMDRVYTDKQWDKDVFIQYAEKNNWKHYYKMPPNIKVQLGNYEYSLYPYMDTLLYYNYIDKYITNYCDIFPKKGYFKLNDTDGEYINDSINDDVVWSNFINNYIDVNDAVYCSDINDWIVYDNAIYLEYLDKYVL